MNQEPITSNLSAAMAKAFAQIDGAVKDATNPHFKNRYADLSAVIDAIKPALVANGLWFTQITHEHDRGVIVETLVFHASGESLSLGRLFVPASKADAQGFGSSLTYGRRYALSTAFGLRTFDDDAEAARAAAERPAKVDDGERIKQAQEAAMQGMKALTKYWTDNQGKPGFGAFWSTYSDGLKAAAANADMVSA